MGFYDVLEISGITLHGIGIPPAFVYSICKARYLDCAAPLEVLDVGMRDRYISAQLARGLDVAAPHEVLDVSQPVRVITCL